MLLSHLVAVDASSLKLTYPLDLQLAEWIVQSGKMDRKQ